MSHLNDFRVTIHALKADMIKQTSESSPKLREAVCSLSVHTSFRKLKGYKHRKVLWKLSLPGPYSFREINGNYVA